MRSSVGFNFDDRYPVHFTSGSILEPISAVLFVLGLGLSLKYVRELRFRFLLIWYPIALIANGVMSPHPFLAVQRISYVIPVVVTLAAVALDSAFRLIEQSLTWDRFIVPVRRLAAATLTSLLVILVLAAVGSNLYRFWHVTPNVDPPGYLSLLVRAVESDTCNRGVRSSIVIGLGHPIVRDAVLSREKAKEPVLLSYDELTAAKDYPLAPCIIYLPKLEPVEETELSPLKQLIAYDRIVQFDSGSRPPPRHVIVFVRE